MKSVVIVDYGIGNIKSVQRGIEKVGANVKISARTEDISSADHLILPGVGAYEDGMKGLNDTGVIPAIREFVQSGKPLLGICLGMQMLLDRSEEHGLHKGLGLIPGIVKAVPQLEGNAIVRKIPHIGWSALLSPPHSDDWRNSILGDTVEGEYFYFVHSFMAAPENDADLLAQCEDEGLRILERFVRD